MRPKLGHSDEEDIEKLEFLGASLHRLFHAHMPPSVVGLLFLASSAACGLGHLRIFGVSPISYFTISSPLLAVTLYPQSSNPVFCSTESTI